MLKGFLYTLLAIGSLWFGFFVFPKLPSPPVIHKPICAAGYVLFHSRYNDPVCIPGYEPKESQ